MLITFAGMQIIFLLLSLFQFITLRAMFIELTAFTGTLVLTVNFNLIFTYCKLAGTPYRSRKFYHSVRWVGLVGGYWTVAFTLKFLLILLGNSLFQIADETS